MIFPVYAAQPGTPSLQWPVLLKIVMGAYPTGHASRGQTISRSHFLIALHTTAVLNESTHRVMWSDHSYYPLGWLKIQTSTAFGYVCEQIQLLP